MPAGMEGMAAADAADRQPAALECAEPADRLHRIFRTAGHEPATGAEQGADPALVAAQQGDEQAGLVKRVA